MKTKAFLGIDTSNYTTSVAICDERGEVLENIKILLPVKQGEVGLRQSDAVFAHVKNFDSISNRIKELGHKYEYLALGYSKAPRNIEGSYMPCFLVGKAVGEMIGSLFNIPTFQFSHQCGHIRAAMYSSKAEIDGDFIAFHVSGGTTEIVLVNPDISGFKTEIIGGSIDLHAGQAIDRIGVKMGLGFPCGKEIERLALENGEKIPSPKICVNGYNANLSGLENLAIKLFNETDNKVLTSAYTLNFIAKTLERLTQNLRCDHPDKPILFAGGVMSNSIIQAQLRKKFENVYFSAPEFSTDNGAGIALLAKERYIG